MSHYHETQMGYSIMFILVLTLWMLCYMGEVTGLLPAIGILALIAALFYRMTIDVVDGEIRVVYGIGLIRKVVKIDQIESVEFMGTPGWWIGAGIRFYGRGWLFSLGFTPALELKLRDKKMRVSIGTKEPQRLAEAIAAARRS